MIIRTVTRIRSGLQTVPGAITGCIQISEKDKDNNYCAGKKDGEITTFDGFQYKT